VLDDPAGPLRAASREVRISAIEIAGSLIVPPAPRALVVFAQGSTSSRFNTWAGELASRLAERGLATLLVDLLLWEEERDRTNVFDIRLLSDRLMASTRWAHTQPDLAALSVGYLGTGTGAAAALYAAAKLGPAVAATVSVDGRPDLADPVLPEVQSPALLIVGSQDHLALELHQEVSRRLAGPSTVAPVPGAKHLFEDTGTLDAVARLASDWFTRYLDP